MVDLAVLLLPAFVLGFWWAWCVCLLFLDLVHCCLVVCCFRAAVFVVYGFGVRGFLLILAAL